jgi:hypothetical protein
MLPRLFVCLACLSLIAAVCDAAEPASKLDFTRDVRPILAGTCFKCHGPDAKARKGRLRLDVRESALKGGRSGQPGIVPGKPDESEAVRRLFAEADSERMPPPSAKLPLTDLQRDILKRWIAEGAEYQPHWAFVAPKQAPLPKVKDANWPINPVDYFVLARLEAEGLRPSPVADRYTLVRRLYLDLIGLPPTPEEADAFVNDTRPEANEKLVDTLLASPHYGERWARRWLDLARYADTNGYEKDRNRSIWPYRDWVIKALNDDMPFDRFTIEQIAGDLLPSATLGQKVATGFHRNTMTNEEGGIDVEEFRFYNIVDRVATTGTVWLGLTLGCAQCHTHKFDPITQQEYYGLFALLNNADEPEIEVPDPAIARKRAEIEAKIQAIEVDYENRFPPRKDAAAGDAGAKRKHLEAKLAEWDITNASKAGHWTPLRPTSVVSKKHATMTVLDDDSVLVSGDWPNNDTYVLELETSLSGITALKLEVLPDPSLPHGGPGRAPLFQEGDFLLSEFIACAGPRNGGALAPVKFVSATQDYAKSGTSAALALDGKLDTGWSILGQVGKAHRAVFVTDRPLGDASGTKFLVTLEQQYIHQMTIGRFRLWATSDAKPAQALGMAANVEAALVAPAAQRSEAQRRAIRRHFLAVAPELKQAHDEVEKLRRAMPKHPTTLVMQERLSQHARVTHLHTRGEFLKLAEVVQPAVPEALHPILRAATVRERGQDRSLTVAAPKVDRLDLARWLVDERNPLVGRVTVNRHWQAFFGQGIVRTTEDFGLRGEPPTHPELLDWLAVELPKRGWSIKALHRLIVTSATYRQSSHVTPELFQRDPANKLLARGARFRIEAEAVRDAALQISGLLTEKVGGPSVFPPQPEGSNAASYGGFNWQTSTGPDRYRRGLYTFTKRTSPYAMFGLFDGPSGESCVARRDRSNTPLQALTMLNDPVFQEAARALAATTPGATPEARAAAMFRRCVTRPPAADELESLVSFYRRQREHTDEPAAWTAIARALLNLDETISKE